MSKKPTGRSLSDDQANAKLPLLKVTPRKLSLVADLIRNLNVSEALAQLEFCRKRISRDVSDLLKSAISNAENNHNLDIDKLYVSEVRVGKAMTMKRFRARARGRGAKIMKFFSNIEIILKEQEEG